jgi:hypothetical protein
MSIGQYNMLKCGIIACRVPDPTRHPAHLSKRPMEGGVCPGAAIHIACLVACAVSCGWWAKKKKIVLPVLNAFQIGLLLAFDCSSCFSSFTDMAILSYRFPSSKPLQLGCGVASILMPICIK